MSVTHKRAPTAKEFEWATGLIDRLGAPFMLALQAAVGEGTGRPGSVPVRAVLVAWALLVSERGHQAEHTDVVAQLVAATDEQLLALGMRRLPAERAYKRFHDKWSKLLKALEAGFSVSQADNTTVTADLDWFGAALVQTSIPPDLPTSSTASVNGTDWETAGRVRQTGELVYDGDAPADTDEPLDQHATAIAKVRVKIAKNGKSYAVGPDDRAIYTTDPDARAGWRTATSGRAGGFYIGHEMHLAVQVRDLTWSGDVERVNFGQEVPSFITAAALSPSGTHRAKSVVPTLLRPELAIKRVIWDRGYSILDFDSAHGPLWAAGIQPTFDLNTCQRRYPPVADNHAIWIDGHLFHEQVPEELRELPRPPMGSTDEVRAAYAAKFNERARWRWTKHSGPDAAGMTRWECPFCSGRLKSRQLKQRKLNKTAVLVGLREGTTKCCDGIIQVGASLLNLLQADGIPYGTTAHNLAYGRRNLVETGNSYLGGTYINLTNTYSRLMGTMKRKFVMAFMLAGLNRYIERSWRAKKAAEATASKDTKRQSPLRRRDTLQHALAGTTPSAAHRGRRGTRPEPPTVRKGTRPRAIPRT